MGGAAGVVVVTGAAGGMGMAVVRRLLADGRDVVAAVRRPHELEVITAGRTRLHVVATDLCDAGMSSLVVEASRATGLPCAGLVNLAGVSVGAGIDAIDDADWASSFEVNATAPMRLCRALVPALRAAGGGAIVNVASPVAIQGARKVSYAASKAALLGLTAALARSLGRDGIRVNAVLPGPTITGMTSDWPVERRENIARSTALGRLCEPEEIAGVISFLLGPDASYMTGAVLDVTGGAFLGGPL